MNNNDKATKVVPHKHAQLLKEYANNPNQKVWMRLNETDQVWGKSDIRDVLDNPKHIYFIGEFPPKINEPNLNRTDQLPYELFNALKQNVRAFRHKQTGNIKYLLTGKDKESLWEDVMIIPNLTNKVIDNTLSKSKVVQNLSPSALGALAALLGQKF